MYSEIAKKLDVSKSTAYSWTSKAPLSKYQINLLQNKLKKLRAEQIRKFVVIHKQKRAEKDLLINNSAATIVKNVNFSKNTKRLLCATLFWCEGGKDVNSGIRFINSDPLLVSKFIDLFRESFDIDETKFRALLHLHEYHDKSKQLLYWSGITKIPTKQFYNPYLKPNTGKNFRVNYPGCISLRYLDSSFAKLLRAIYLEFGKRA